MCCARLQIVFQNPGEALNPHLTIGETLRRPFIRLLGFSSKDAQEEVNKLLEAVHLPVEYTNRFPGQLSGGEIQRIALARAIASNPDLLILDEPISSLDVSVQAAMLNLVGELQGDHHNSLLFISHNLAIVGYLANQTAVIYVGNLMELSGQGDLFKPPHHPYTEALISAIPQINRESNAAPIHLEGEIPNPTDIPGGCPFHTRCPRFIGDICAEKIPTWQVDPSTNKSIFCHIPLAELSASQVQMVAKKFKLAVPIDVTISPAPHGVSRPDCPAHLLIGVPGHPMAAGGCMPHHLGPGGRPWSNCKLPPGIGIGPASAGAVLELAR